MIFDYSKKPSTKVDHMPFTYNYTLASRQLDPTLYPLLSRPWSTLRVQAPFVPCPAGALCPQVSMLGTSPSLEPKVPPFHSLQAYKIKCMECLLCTRHQAYPNTRGGRARTLQEFIAYVYMLES